MIDIENATVTLGGRAILNQLTFALPAGMKAALSGLSGSGKTTLLRVLIGRQHLNEGIVRIDGKSFVPANLAAIRAKTFYLPQDIRPVGDETVAAFIAEPFQYIVNRKLGFKQDAVSAHFENLRLRPALLNAKFHELSGGERKRVGIVRCLMLKRPIVLLDEPTAGVDEENRNLVLESILGMTDATVLAVSHDADFNDRVDRSWELRDGQVRERKQ